MAFAWRRLAGPVAIAAGAAAIAGAVAQGSAEFYLVVIIPVVAGSSALLLLGAFLLFVGVFLLPLTFAGANTTEGPSRTVGPVASERTTGGLVLVGPLPIFFGGWARPTRTVYWLAVAIGAAGCVVLALLLLG